MQCRQIAVEMGPWESRLTGLWELGALAQGSHLPPLSTSGGKAESYFPSSYVFLGEGCSW